MEVDHTVTHYADTIGTEILKCGRVKQKRLKIPKLLFCLFVLRHSLKIYLLRERKKEPEFRSDICSVQDWTRDLILASPVFFPLGHFRFWFCLIYLFYLFNERDRNLKFLNTRSDILHTRSQKCRVGCFLFFMFPCDYVTQYIVDQKCEGVVGSCKNHL